MARKKKMASLSQQKPSFMTYTILVGLAAIVIVPLMLIFFNSFKPESELYQATLNIIPDTWTLENYRSALDSGNYLRYFANTIIVAVTATIMTVLFSTMAGYALAKFKMKSASMFLTIFIATVMVPLEAYMISEFLVVQATGLYNTLWAIIIPTVATPTGIFMMRQYILGIPDELIEAARIDGETEWGIFFKIIMPLAKPAMASLTIFSFMWRWNDYLLPLITISDPDKYTLQMAIANFSGEYYVDWPSLLAITVLTLIPVIIVFVVFSKQFTESIANTGGKE